MSRKEMAWWLRLAVLMMVGSHWAWGQCETSIPKLISQCGQYVEGSGPETTPSKACCDVITSLDIPCMCKYVTPDVEKLVNMEKVVFVAKSCGLTLQPGMKCGSFVVPPSV
ncbi:hypothetical protein ERO13_D07G126100v2 [Gossypium hirsutum]|uniref:Bifunctional inhibitor/plant lipid transfer protein/seed storage helical domain-containing protein n=9 Tax=Gossypium TaxID=3633 RepID=A0A1U8P288_GOSHI|nr:uncharacterized protein LOC107954307 [Gossypium hirsutum]KAB2021378.1 hypothetical protein ES319_D07G135000v1 [Gossypium barbadense]KAG4138299.1 hypothetical protein ERO13_D07G126100v2 [Gossypium hirsutum]TYG61378.1 hypothetical protein ES288_D07G143300v1 [Gossypium darwinii]TYH62759.1 hypothetical protein ES332_D07G141900v1 [Gossypium tomentosum]